MNEIATTHQPRALAGLADPPPPFFSPMKKPGNGSSASSPHISAIATRDAPITRQHAGFRNGARVGDCST
jgi:hypothetical protein